jgi:hypothetical protein
MSNVTAREKSRAARSVSAWLASNVAPDAMRAIRVGVPQRRPTPCCVRWII